MAKMPGNPPFSVVSPETTAISPPRKFGPAGLALWNAVMAEYRIEDRGGIELLTEACAARDRTEELAAIIDRDGAIIYTKADVPKIHPAVREELSGRAFVVKALERLGLNVEVLKSPGRPLKPFGWTPT